MRVAQTQRSAQAKQSRSSGATSRRGGDFKLPQGRSSARRAEVSGPMALGSVDAIVALQAVEEPSDRRRRAVATGDRILDQLEKLKIGLLSGQVSQGEIEKLKTAIAKQENVNDDPALKDLLDQIDLRARVELAKLKAGGVL